MTVIFAGPLDQSNNATTINHPRAKTPANVEAVSSQGSITTLRARASEIADTNCQHHNITYRYVSSTRPISNDPNRYDPWLAVLRRALRSPDGCAVAVRPRYGSIDTIRDNHAGNRYKHFERRAAELCTRRSIDGRICRLGDHASGTGASQQTGIARYVCSAGHPRASCAAARHVGSS